jgi:hypothetical protein
MAGAVSHPLMGGGGGRGVAGIIHPGHLQAGLAVILMNFITLHVRWYTVKKGLRFSCPQPGCH